MYWQKVGQLFFSETFFLSFFDINDDERDDFFFQQDITSCRRNNEERRVCAVHGMHSELQILDGIMDSKQRYLTAFLLPSEIFHSSNSKALSVSLLIFLMFLFLSTLCRVFSCGFLQISSRNGPCLDKKRCEITAVCEVLSR